MSNFQTRSTNGVIDNFANFEAAYQHYSKNNIRKISWCDVNRWNCKRKCDRWLPESEAKLCSLSEDYAAEPANSTKIYWVRQSTTSPNAKEIRANKLLTPEKQESVILLGCIDSVLTDTQFYETYKKI